MMDPAPLVKQMTKNGEVAGGFVVTAMDVGFVASIGKGPVPRDIMGWRQDRECAKKSVVKEVPRSAQQLGQDVAVEGKRKSLPKITQGKD